MIEVESLSKHYGYIKAVDNISFSIPKGQVVAFIGPNGAGKSTTMKMLVGFLQQSKGKIKIADIDLNKDVISAQKKIGYLPEVSSSYQEMTVCEFLSFIADIREIKPHNKPSALESVKETCFLKEVWHQNIETLSKGFKQRVGFAQALIHDPEILVLDEPTDGLDPNQKHEMRNLIKSMGANKTIILSTHILEEVEAVCSRVIIIAKGKIVADESTEAILERGRLDETFRKLTLK